MSHSEIRLPHGTDEGGQEIAPQLLDWERAVLIAGRLDADGKIQAFIPQTDELVEYLAPTSIAPGGGSVDSDEIDMRDYDGLFLVLERTAGAGNLMDFGIQENETGNTNAPRDSSDNNIWALTALTGDRRVVVFPGGEIGGFRLIIRLTNNDVTDAATWRVRARRFGYRSDSS